MPLQKHTLPLALSLILCGSLIFMFTIEPPHKELEGIGAAAIPTHSPITISGFDYATYQDARLISEIHADLLQVVPRKMFAFRLRSINELVLRGVEIKSYGVTEGEYGGLLSPSDLTGQVQRMKGVKGLGRISQVRLERFRATLHTDGIPTTLVRAEKGEIDPKSKITHLYNASLEHPQSDRIISSKRIDWDEQEKHFIVPGDYLVKTARGMAKGEGISVGADFSIQKLPPAIKP